MRASMLAIPALVVFLGGCGGTTDTPTAGEEDVTRASTPLSSSSPSAPPVAEEAPIGPDGLIRPGEHSDPEFFVEAMWADTEYYGGDRSELSADAAAGVEKLWLELGEIACEDYSRFGVEETVTGGMERTTTRDGEITASLVYGNAAYLCPEFEEEMLSFLGSRQLDE